VPIVFVAGCGRSGTSYLRTVLDAHPDVFIPSESLFLTDYLKYGRYVPKRLLQWLFFHEPQLGCWYEKGAFPIEDVRTAIARVHEIAARDEGARIWGQKTPRFVRHMGLFNHHFEGIKWLLIYRDPRAVAASMLDSGQHTYSVMHACRRWKNDNREIVRMLRRNRTLPDVMLIKYEDLILNYGPMLESIFRFLSLDPIDRDEVNRRGRPVFFKRSRFKPNTIREDLNPDPRVVDSWRKRLVPAEIQYIEEACGQEMRIMGYEPVAAPGARRRKRFLVERMKDVSILFQYGLKWPEYLIITAIRTIILRTCWLCHGLFGARVPDRGWEISRRGAEDAVQTNG
jgi:hypothetical protein